MPQHSYHQEPEPRPNTPYIPVTVKNTFGFMPKEFFCEALLDTGSDFSIFPLRELEAIGLQPIGNDMVLQGVSYARVRPFAASLVIGDRQILAAPLGWNHDISILGRDVLNLWRIDFDGPLSTFTLYQ